MVNKWQSVAVGVLCIGGIGGGLAYANLKPKAEELRQQDERKLHEKFAERLKDAGCDINFSGARRRENPSIIPRRDDLLNYGYKSLYEKENVYITGEGGLNECTAKEEVKKYDNSNAPYWSSFMPAIYGLPISFQGEDIFVTSQIESSEGVLVVALGLNSYDCYDIQYKKGKFNRGYGHPVDLVVIRGYMDYCIEQIYRSDGESVYADNQLCDSRLGKLEIAIKPDNLEQTCAEINRDIDTTINNPPSQISYMWRAL